MYVHCAWGFIKFLLKNKILYFLAHNYYCFNRNVVLIVSEIKLISSSYSDDAHKAASHRLISKINGSAAKKKIDYRDILI